MTTRIAETIRQFQTGQNHEKNKQTVKSSNMPQKLSERAWLVVNRYGDGESFAKKFNPSLQVVCAQNVERSFRGNAPSLALLGETYPDEQVNTWIIAQLMDLYKFAGVKEKPTFQQVLELSVMIRVEYYYLKASELLLFFFKLKAGEYGTFYGVVDPMVIMSNRVQSIQKKATGEIRPGRTGKTTRRKIREAR
jgi:hypothetical protein